MPPWFVNVKDKQKLKTKKCACSPPSESDALSESSEVDRPTTFDILKQTMLSFLMDQATYLALSLICMAMHLTGMSSLMKATVGKVGCKFL